MKNAKVISIHGKRWFQKTYGNTYHSASVNVDGKSIGGCDFAYGYGDQYLVSAETVLRKAGYLADMEENESLWRYCERKGIILNNVVSDVTAKKYLGGAL